MPPQRSRWSAWLLFMFLGLEFVTPLAPSMRAPQRTIPRAMGLAFLLAGVATINTLMAALPRLLYGVARDSALPRAFAWLHPHHRKPLLGTVVSAAIPIAGAIAVRGDVTRVMPLVLAGVCAWSGTYILVNLSLVMLRWHRPDLPRLFRTPWFPLPQLLASAGIVAALTDIAPPPILPAAGYGPFIVVLAGSFVYALVWTIVVRHQAPSTPVPVEQVLERAWGAAAARDAA